MIMNLLPLLPRLLYAKDHLKNIERVMDCSGNLVFFKDAQEIIKRLDVAGREWRAAYATTAVFLRGLMSDYAAAHVGT
jgi:hypothetical protein